MKTPSFCRTLILAASLLFTSALSAAQFRYNELMIKDYDEMHSMMQVFLKKSRSVGSNTADADDNSGDVEAIAQLREALKLIFTRPNTDNMIAKLLPELRRELVGYSAYEDSLSGLSAEALDVLKNKKAADSSQISALFVLENLMSEIRPEAATNGDLRRIVQRVKDANVRITDGVDHEMKRRMFKPFNPSQTAADILKKLPKAEPPKKKEAPKKTEDSED